MYVFLTAGTTKGLPLSQGCQLLGQGADPKHTALWPRMLRGTIGEPAASVAPDRPLPFTRQRTGDRSLPTEPWREIPLPHLRARREGDSHLHNPTPRAIPNVLF